MSSHQEAYGDRADGLDLLADGAAHRAEVKDVATGLKRVALEFLGKYEGFTTKHKHARKKPRTKATEWLYCSHKTLSTMVNGAGWKYFLVDEDKMANMPAVDWPSCDLAADQGADVVSGWCWLRSQNVNCSYFPDTSHGCWNDTKLALQRNGLWSHCLIMLVLHNMHHKPYQNCTYWRQLLGAFKEYFRVMTPNDCPLFTKWYAEILADLGIVDMAGHLSELQREIWKRLSRPEEVLPKGDVISLATWFGLTDRSDELLKQWAIKRVVCLVLCGTIGLLGWPVLADSGQPVLRRPAGDVAHAGGHGRPRSAAEGWRQGRRR